MRTRHDDMHDWLLETWYGNTRRGALLLPLSGLYAALARLRRFAYEQGWLARYRSPRPVIIVGNLTVGGTGKTPLILWLVEQLRLRGRRPGIVSRGYGRSSRAVRRVSATDPVTQVGDEPVLLARRTGVPVAVGADRAAAVRLLEDECDVVLSDDGLQHYALERDCEIVVVDGSRSLGNRWRLPAGPLREAPARLHEVDAVVVNGDGPAVAGAMRMEVAALRFVGVSSGESCPPDAFRGHRAYAVAAIGHPRRFFDMLARLGIRLEARPLRDHAVLTAADIDLPGSDPVLMTEKDAVKCAGIAGPRHWYLEVGAGFSPIDAGRLLAIVDAACRRSS